MRGSTHLPQAVILLAITTLAGTTVVSDPQTSNPPTDTSESNRLVYRGRVIDGVTGEPLSGVFVGAPGVLMPETGFVTQAQWAALHRLPASPEIGSPAIDCIRDKCKVRALTRTASDGQFALSVPPDFWLKDRSQANANRLSANELIQKSSFLVFEQNYLPFRVHHSQIRADRDGDIQIETVRLHPIATVVLMPVGPASDEEIAAHWHVGDDSPFSRDFPRYQPYMTLLLIGMTTQQTNTRRVQIPANVETMIILGQRPQNQKCPVALGPFNVDPGQTLDLGTVRLESEIAIRVRVTDQHNRPMQKIKVTNQVMDLTSSFLYSSETDAEGYAQFNVPPSYWGTFNAICRAGDRTLKHSLPYQTSGQSDAGKTFVIKLPKNILQAMASARLQDVLSMRKREGKNLAEEVLKGRNAYVRIYNDWRNGARTYDLISVPIEGVCVSKTYLSEQAVGIDRFDVIVVAPRDQQDQAVSTLLGNRVLVCMYIDSEPLSLWPESLKSPSKTNWTLTDVLGAPLAETEVEIALEQRGMLSSRPSVGRLWLANARTDRNGRLPIVDVASRYWTSAIVVKNPTGGSVYAVPQQPEHGVFVVPFTRHVLPSKALFWGTVLDAHGLPAENIVVEGGVIKGPGGASLGKRNRYGHKAITDEYGRFSLALTTAEGTLPPPHSHCLVHIDRLSEPRYWYGYVPLGRQCTISLKDFPLHFHTFTFENQNGTITDPGLLRKIQIEILRPDKQRLRLEYSLFHEGMKLPPGTYRAFTAEQDSRTFHAIQVDDDSPEQLVFRMQQDVLYRGRTVHALTGEPVPFALVMAGQYRPGVPHMNPRDRMDAAIVTEQQWQAIHELRAEPLPAHPALDPLRRFSNPTKVIRADADGRFAFAAEGQSNFDEVWAIQENFLPCIYSMRDASGITISRNDSAARGGQDIVELPAFKLVPAARVSLEPYVEGLEQNIPVRIRLNMERHPCPQQIRRLGPTWLSGAREVAANRSCAMLVPASVRSVIELLPRSNPKDVPYPPGLTKLDVPAMQQGKTLDLGRQPLGPRPQTFAIGLHVVDSANRPVPDLGVWCDPNHKHLWGSSAATNANGLVEFKVPVPCRGTFVVSIKNEISDPDIKQSMDFEIMDEQDIGKHFMFVLSDRMYKLLFP